MSSIVVKDVEENNSLIWYRNDLRVDNHSGLFNAIRNSDKILGFYCFNPKMFELNELNFHKTDNYRAKFLIESVENLRKRFGSGSMSHGALSSEAHETLAVAMNRIGAASCSGE